MRPRISIRDLVRPLVGSTVLWSVGARRKEQRGGMRVEVEGGVESNEESEKRERKKKTWF